MNYLDLRNNFEFKGFIPNQQIKNKSESFYNQIEKLSPSDSKKVAILKKTKEGYTARLKVSSASACSFDISCKQSNANRSMLSLQKEFFDQIRKWNKKRLDTDILFKK